uniref:ISXO2-like transposase domain-containing protein n=1 Tax=Trichuris muris TaxID=70415 RepID=A0A5S6QWM3_TRIMR
MKVQPSRSYRRRQSCISRGDVFAPKTWCWTCIVHQLAGDAHGRTAAKSCRCVHWRGRRSNLPVRKTLLFIRAWSDKLTSCAFCKDSFGTNGKAAVEWNLTLRAAAAEWLFKNRVTVGRPGLRVEVDESLFSKRKYNRGRVLPQTWVVGSVCRETGEWQGYYRLSNEHNAHLLINHSINFVDRVTGAHTQTVESLWSHAKQGNKVRHGTHRFMLDSYLCEFIRRRRLRSHQDPQASTSMTLQRTGLRSDHCGMTVVQLSFYVRVLCSI